MGKKKKAAQTAVEAFAETTPEVWENECETVEDIVEPCSEENDKLEEIPEEKEETIVENHPAEARIILRMDSGAVYTVTGDNGKYYLCGNTQFRKNNRHIVSVKQE